MSETALTHSRTIEGDHRVWTVTGPRGCVEYREDAETHEPIAVSIPGCYGMCDALTEHTDRLERVLNGLATDDEIWAELEDRYRWHWPNRAGDSR